MQKEVYHIPWISVTFVLLAIAIVGFFTQSETGVTGALVYRDYGYGGYGGGYGGGSYYGGGFGYGLTITEFYQSYAAYIDAVIFLLIFLGVGKSIFMDHFKSGGKAVYVAVGLALTLGLMMWEERENRSIISELGPWGLAILVIIVLAGCYIAALNLSERFTGRRKHWLAILLTLLFATVLATIFPDTAQYLKDGLNYLWTGVLWAVGSASRALNLSSPPEAIIWTLFLGAIGFLFTRKILKRRTTTP